MKKNSNEVFLNILGIALILFPAISCSGSGQEKVQKEEKKNTPVITETEKMKTNSDKVKKTTCTTCHTTDENGDLSFKSIDGKLILKEKTPQNMKH